MHRPHYWVRALALLPFLGSIAAAESYTYLHQYNAPLPVPGCQPWSTLVETTPGTFYGTTTNCNATIFSVTTGGVYKMLANLNVGDFPLGALLHASDGNLYGVTIDGEVFRSDLQGNNTVIATAYGGGGNIYGIGSAYPLIEDETATFYGTGASGVYSMNFAGVVTPLCTISGISGGVIKAGDGNLYGVASNGIFRCSLNGQLTSIYSGLPGSPYGTLTQSTDGRLYGITQGPNVAYSVTLDGSDFTSVITDPYGETSGQAALALLPSGLLIGGNRLGGQYGGGILYSLTNQTTFKTLLNFSDVHYNAPITPDGAVVQGIDGTLYGTLSSTGTGASDLGAIYALNLGLKPPSPLVAAFYPVSGPAGTQVLIRGKYLLAATAVFFNSTKASFIVDSGGFVTATVPAGATSGPIHIFTPNGRVASSQTFAVE